MKSSPSSLPSLSDDDLATVFGGAPNVAIICGKGNGRARVNPQGYKRPKR